MPHSEDDFGFSEEKAGQNLAVLAESLFLINLLLLPGLAFAGLFALWLKNRDSSPPLARLWCGSRQHSPPLVPPPSSSHPVVSRSRHRRRPAY